MIFKGFFSNNSDPLLFDDNGIDLNSMNNISYEKLIINNEVVVPKSLGRFGYYTIINNELYLSVELVRLASQEIESQGYSIDIDRMMNQGVSDGFVKELISSKVISEYDKSVIIDYLISSNKFNWLSELINEESINPLIITGLINNMQLSLNHLLVIHDSRLPLSCKRAIINNKISMVDGGLSDKLSVMVTPEDKIWLLSQYDEFKPIIVKKLMNGVKLWDCNASELSKYRVEALKVITKHYSPTNKQFNKIMRDYDDNIIIMKQSIMNGYKPTTRQVDYLIKRELTSILTQAVMNGLRLTSKQVDKVLMSDNYGFKNAVITALLINNQDEELISKALSNKLINPIKWLVKHKVIKKRLARSII